MKEIAFQIKRDSEFYKKYFETKAEKEKFHKLARIFFEKYDLLDNLEYYQTEFLGLKLTIEQRERFKKQIKNTQMIRECQYSKNFLLCKRLGKKKSLRILIFKF